MVVVGGGEVVSYGSKKPYSVLRGTQRARDKT